MLNKTNSHAADAILSSTLNIPLRGVAIGNGWMDARRQYPAYLDYATKHGLLEEGSNVRFFLFIFRDSDSDSDSGC